MKQLIIIAFIAIVCLVKLVQTQFADIDKNNPNEMYKITLIKNGVSE